MNYNEIVYDSKAVFGENDYGESLLVLNDLKNNILKNKERKLGR